ncbi:MULTISPECIES: bifunctional [glutamine synthetase] adenylyltransferase/[glutamine synthetase]-adenylyl-L-tyrosine phosphorylase [unclassified Novosphingobium]|uniref:bifunctional [glutamine synthetase] adenylyltransferase/[glutamine synthetase]-adenylyl-L-tyrosine phosphorylase n=1 Tax=unclassified Novosphingobium TaxID=2644732 RepID=UPI000ECBD9E3|nr:MULTISPECIES: bifunctional [glutamine synthetase] adenylyltransferase/[glutamine synthetase]-adenylyl-L-tyrosine phosphorylase [unclassified Novosphingobium]HCF25477.1 glutamine-synthetase adenylyltransferase [Novosphingobium sp.]HQV03221.1 bifunctional [glutamine synthetase] adenylyltransferase/[glutamine synthetase]-adenylyl-L-tyrosine phosphorylase [Novosphingobium sp.]
MSADWTSALTRAQAHAPFLERGLEQLPQLQALLAAGRGEEALAWVKAAGADAPDTGSALRREKSALALALAIGDLAGAFPLSRVVQELSDFADRALDAAIAAAIRARVPDAEPAGFIALALGKHGARELNYSSDIDPILLYDPATLPRRERDEPGEAAQRVARTLMQLMSHVDHEGYVFRVDLRLRPASEVSPLAIPYEAALTHYESSALAWERAAFIRARACAGDVAAGESFLAAIRPFVWRRSLDFGAIAEIGRLTRRIRANHSGPLRPGPGFNLKQGRGGIREVEFFAQTHQLIHGGRNPALRLRGTRASLDALAAAGLIDPEDARVLGESYDRLRTLEHRLQMVADQQTHSLPAEPAALDNVARLEGLPDGAALVAELDAITEAVGTRYDRLIAQYAEDDAGSAAPAPGGAALEDKLAELGFADPAGLCARIEGWRSGKLRALRSDAAREAFDAMLLPLLAAFAKGPEPERALLRWEQLLTNLPSAVNLFRLLEARPALGELLARILGLAQPLADALARRADLLDGLFDASAFDLPGSVDDLVSQLSAGEADDDYERLLDRVRRRVGELRFKLGVQLIEGSRDPMAVGQALSRVAEAALAVLAEAATTEFEKVHGRVPGGALMIMGYGRLGGGALTHASDLDLVFLFTGEHSAESDGARPLGATLYFNRLAQRVIAALSVPTAEGALYEVDTRLRPSGAQGPIAVSLDAFERYQREAAWTWEHMALARARVLHGPIKGRAALNGIVHSVLELPRDPAKLRGDVLEMRRTMAEHKPAKSPLDVKLARGGLVDIEFIVHFLQLRDHRALVPAIPDALAELADAGMIDPAIRTAHRTLGRFLIAARLLLPEGEEPPPAARAVLASACECEDWTCLTDKLAESRRTVAQAWQATFGEDLEIE